MDTAPQISVVVPLRNESGNVSELARQISDALAPINRDFELILVDDGSTDDTWEKIKNAHRQHPELRGLRHKSNSGQSAGLWSGFRAAKGEIIATLDGDLQNDPADLPMLLSELSSADMVCGVRTRRADNWVRRVSSAVARFFRKSLLGLDFSDSGCNLRVFRRSVISLLPAFDGLHRFMPFFVHNAGGTVRQVPVNHRPRVAGRSNYGVWNRMLRGLRDLIMVRWYLSRQIRPIPTEVLDQERGKAVATEQ
jgi:dolichol-phosphate mannosyltransferase